MWNERLSGTALRHKVTERLRSSLPAGWGLRVLAESSPGHLPDALIEISAPVGPGVPVVLEVKRQIEPRDVASVIEQLQATEVKNGLAVAPFLSPRTRQMLADRGAGYADATGNLRLVLDQPAVFIERTGAESSPWRENRPLHSLKGPAAARVIRALCDFRPPYTVGDLAVRAATPASSVSRVLALLGREALLTRGPRGSVVEVQWNELLHRWIEDYSLLKSNRVASFLEPRGMMPLNYRLQAVNWPYAVTGSAAAVHRVPITVVRLQTIYVEAIEPAAEWLLLRPAETGANVLLVEPLDRVVFERTWEHDHNVRYCALSQVAADMLTSPGRAPAEAEELLHWMGEHEDEWRT